MKLNKFTNWDDKINMFINQLPPQYMKLSANTKSMCLTIYKHVYALLKYDMTQLPKITSPIVLFKPTMKTLNFSQEDYGLHKVYQVLSLL